MFNQFNVNFAMDAINLSVVMQGLLLFRRLKKIKLITWATTRGTVTHIPTFIIQDGGAIPNFHG